MSPSGPHAFLTHFHTLPDPRKQTDNTVHKFLDILMIAVCGALCGADNWTAVEAFGKAQKTWLQGFLELPKEIPSHDTFTTVFRRIEPEHFQACFVSWVTSLADLLPGEVVAIDGKTLRHSYDRQNSRAAIHMVSAWASHQSLVLGQLKTAAKSNEITAIPQLLEVLELTGCLVTIDAMGCQKAIAQKIRGGGADYLLAVKDNHPTLCRAVTEHFAPEQATTLGQHDVDFDWSEERNRDRNELRRCWVEYDLSWLSQREEWPDLQAIVRIESVRTQPGQTSYENRYYLSSASFDAETFLQKTRAHWSIENSLHWVLDVAFCEDACRIRKGYGAENVAIIRHIVVNLLQHDRSSPVGMRTKRLQAGWDVRYREQLLKKGGIDIETLSTLIC